MQKPIRWLVGLLSSLVFPLVAAALGWDEPWLVVGASALFGALCLWNLNHSYRGWINDERAGWKVPTWLKHNLSFAMVGVVFVLGAALLMRWSSAENEQIGIAYALGLWLAGMVPVVQVVRARLADIADIADIDDLAEALPVVVAWLLNIALISLTTIAPAVAITGFEWSGFLVGLGAGGIWLAFEFAGWLVGKRSWMVLIGAALMVVPVVFVMLGPADLVSLKILYLFPIGLALVSARQRGEAPLTMAPLMRKQTVGWVGIGAVGLVSAFAGGAWWVAVLGDDVSTTLLLIGAAGAMAFGVSLITRGEGLLVVVLMGLLMVWVVQDHTGEPAPLAAVDSPLVLAAFGDSYLSGEGIGSFYADTNTAGADDLSITGVNECRRSEFAFSPLVARAQSLDLAFYGCSGALATTGDFADLDLDLDEALEREFDANSVYGQLLRWEKERGTGNDPELVLLSLGGNDAGFAKIGAACFLPGSCDNALDASSTPALEGVTERVATALVKAREVFPTSPMVVVAYPQMFGPDADECGGQVPFNGTETRALRNFVDALNVAVGLAVENVDDDQLVHFTGATAAYDGERFCELGADGKLVKPAAIRSLAFQPTDGDDLFDRLGPAKIIHNTFHPTRRGHELVTAKLTEFLDAGCHLGVDGGSCAADMVPVSVPPATPDAQPAKLVELVGEAPEGELEEVVDDAPVGGCNELASFQRCTIIQSLRLVLMPLVLMVVGGLALALAVKRGKLIEWATQRLPFGRVAIKITPLDGDY